MPTTKQVVDEFNKMTVPELKSYAKKNNIDVVGATTKINLLEAILPFVPREDVKTTVKKKKEEKIAIYSEKNLFWSGVGELQNGYNIVTKEASVKWLTHKSVREVTPEEVAKYYGKT